MDTMASNDSNKQDPAAVERSEQLVDRFLDAIWMERGLSKNTLGAYRADLMTLGRGLAEQSKAIDEAEKADLLAFIAQRVEAGAKPRSTARQLSRRVWLSRGVNCSGVFISLRCLRPAR